MKDSLNDLLSVIEDMVREIDDTGETRGDQDNAVDDDIRPSMFDTGIGRSGLVLDRLTDDVWFLQFLNIAKIYRYNFLGN